MSTQSQVNEIDPVTVELEVQVPWDRVQKGLDAGYGKLQKTAKVRGFRPGKVPRQVLRQLYGPQVQVEVIQTLVEEGLLEAVQSHELAVVASPEMEELPRIQKGEPLAFKAKLQVRPKIESIEYEGLEVARPSSEVSDDEVAAEIERMRQGEATLVTPEEPRPAKAGDMLTVSYTVEIDGEEKPEMTAEGRKVELGADSLLTEFEEGLTGAKPGDDVEIRVAYDDDVPNPDLKGKRALFKVHVDELQEKQLPALDDELAKDLGDWETLDELRAGVRERLEKAAKERSDSAVREAVIEALVDKNPVPVPPSLIEQQERAMQQELAFFMRIAGQAGGGIDPSMFADMKPRAEKKVRAAILMGELARQQELDVSDEEIDAKLQEIAEETGKHIAKVRAEHAGDKRESLENKLLEDKLLAFLLERATVSDAPPDGPSEEAAGE